MGRWKSFTGLKVDQLDDAIREIMEEYGDIIFKASDEGIDAAAKELARLEKTATPKDSGEAARGWRVQAPRYKLVRFVGNSKTVQGADGEIALMNILEYSTTRSKPFIKKTFEANIDALARIVMGRIEQDA